MSFIVFYSWQSDLPSATNRSFIQKALENATKAIRKDEAIKVEPVVDRDTDGVPGSPNIVDTILKKIEQSQVFVCDVSIINQGTDTRPTPNPNVLIELGYAIKCLGSERVVMVLNTAYGKPEQLPFDLRMRRVLTYEMLEVNTDRATERKKLEQTLEHALRLLVEESVQTQPTSTNTIVLETIASIQNVKPNADSQVRKAIAYLTDKIDSLAPDFSTEGEWDELLVQAIANTTPLIIDFAQIAEIIAEMDSYKIALGFYKGFERILQGYRLPRGVQGSFRDNDFDFFKFIGHELFVSFLSLLIRESRWELIANLLNEGLYVENATRRGAKMVSFSYISQPVELLEHRKQRLGLRKKSVHADILNERHTQGFLAEIVPMQQFMNADFFLFLRPERWHPWSWIYLEDVPRFLLEAQRAKYAEHLLRPLGIDNISNLRKRIKEQCKALSTRDIDFYDTPFGNYDVQKIGSQ